MNKYTKSVLVLAIALAVILAIQSVRNNKTANELQVKYRYLLITTEADANWQSNHVVSINWQNNDINLPVVFRLAGTDTQEMGAGDEASHLVRIGNQELTISVKPVAPVRLSNMLALGILQEYPNRGNTISVATWVTVTPKHLANSFNPHNIVGDYTKNNSILYAKIRQVINAGKVIDIPPNQH